MLSTKVCVKVEKQPLLQYLYKNHDCTLQTTNFCYALFRYLTECAPTHLRKARALLRSHAVQEL